MAQVHPGHAGAGGQGQSLQVSLDEDHPPQRREVLRNASDNRILPSTTLRQYSNSRPTPPSSARHSLIGTPSLKRLSTASDQFALDAEDLISQRSVTPSAGGHHSRSNSLRRKPVPSFLPAPNVSLPSSHPFAHGIIPPAPESSVPEPSTDKDLFYTPAKRGLPAPPRSRPLSLVKPARKGNDSGSGSEQEGSGMSPRSRKEARPEGNIPSRTSSLHGHPDRLEPVRPGKAASRNATPSPEKDLPPVPPHNEPPTPTASFESPIAPQTPHAPEQAHIPEIADPEKTPRQPHTWAGTLGEPISHAAHRLTKNFGMPLEKAQDEVAAPPSPKAERRVSLFPNGEDIEDETFSVDRVPSKRRLFEAGTLFVRDEDGNGVCVGDLFPKYPTLEEQQASQKPLPKTVLLFIRNWGCGQCQDYLFASVSQLDPEVLEKANVKVAIIGCGGWKTIKAYRKLFSCPFPIYVDTTNKLYTMMGMIKYTNNFGPWFKGRAAYHQRPVPTQVIHGFKNLIKHMPLSTMAQPGKILQLGGEFILSPGFKCDFAHRMTTTSNHMEAPDVLRRAGVQYPTKQEAAEARYTTQQQEELEKMQEEMHTWRKGREAELERIRRKKAARRGEEYKPATRESMFGLGLDEELDQLELAPNGDGENGNLELHVDDEPAGVLEDEEINAGLACPMPNGDAEAQEILLDDTVDQSEYEADLELESLHRLNSEELDRRFSAAMKLEEQKERELAEADKLRENGGARTLESSH